VSGFIGVLNSRIAGIRLFQASNRLRCTSRDSLGGVLSHVVRTMTGVMVINQAKSCWRESGLLQTPSASTPTSPAEMFQFPAVLAIVLSVGFAAVEAVPFQDAVSIMLFFRVTNPGSHDPRGGARRRGCVQAVGPGVDHPNFLGAKLHRQLDHCRHQLRAMHKPAERVPGPH
jgi:hypothetical protein